MYGFQPLPSLMSGSRIICEGPFSTHCAKPCIVDEAAIHAHDHQAVFVVPCQPCSLALLGQNSMYLPECLRQTDQVLLAMRLALATTV